VRKPRDKERQFQEPTNKSSAFKRDLNVRPAKSLVSGQDPPIRWIEAQCERHVPYESVGVLGDGYHVLVPRPRTGHVSVKRWIAPRGSCMEVTGSRAVRREIQCQSSTESKLIGLSAGTGSREDDGAVIPNCRVSLQNRIAPACSCRNGNSAEEGLNREQASHRESSDRSKSRLDGKSTEEMSQRVLSLSLAT
jgi:hypothetical protein